LAQLEQHLYRFAGRRPMPRETANAKGKTAQKNRPAKRKNAK
jgi:hypothetical protein